jgi:quercetin 2,3-dioxygenase
VKFLQIWMFPNKKDVTPRYDQITLDADKNHNAWQQVLSPNADDEGVWVHQNAWFSMTKLDAGKSLDYRVKGKGNGLYYFILEGEVEVDGQKLGKRDGFGVWETEQSKLTASTNAEVLLMEVPMN